MNSPTCTSSTPDCMTGLALSVEEKTFLTSVEKGDYESVKTTLEETAIYYNLNINCMDPLGRSALFIAIENENLEIMELLLSHNVYVGDALLYAIRKEVVGAVKLLLDYKKGKQVSMVTMDTKLSEFTQDITPLIVATRTNNYEIIKLLVHSGMIIPNPHQIQCNCVECVPSSDLDSLQHSLSKLNIYKALASPFLIALSSEDPILTAFQLGWELKELSKVEDEFRTEYEELSQQCKSFAKDLLGHAISSRELVTILNHRDDQSEELDPQKSHNLAKLKAAIKYHQKEHALSPDLHMEGPKPTVVEWLILQWILGLIWREIKEMRNEGLNAYVHNWWNLMDFAINSLCLATISLKSVAYVKYNGTRPRAEWEMFHPTSVAEALFAISHVLSSLRLISLFPANSHLGPLQIALGRVLLDILKFLLIYCLVLLAFANGLNQLYFYYATSAAEEHKNCKGIHCEIQNNAFSTFFETLQSLFWALFGLVNLQVMNIDSSHEFTEFVGATMFGTYTVISLIVLLNMLVAIMNNSYKLIADHADTEWKFARAKLWISYFEEGGTLPPPFNIIVTPKSVWYLCKRIHSKLFPGCEHTRKRHENLKTFTERYADNMIQNANYQEVIRNLVKRYVTAMIRNLKTKENCKDWRQDIQRFSTSKTESFKRHGQHIPELASDPVYTISDGLIQPRSIWQDIKHAESGLEYFRSNIKLVNMSHDGNIAAQRNDPSPICSNSVLLAPSHCSSGTKIHKTSSIKSNSSRDQLMNKVIDGQEEHLLTKL